MYLVAFRLYLILIETAWEPCFADEKSHMYNGELKCLGNFFVLLNKMRIRNYKLASSIIVINISLGSLFSPINLFALFTYLTCKVKKTCPGHFFLKGPDSGKTRQDSIKRSLIFFWSLKESRDSVYLSRYGDDLAGKYLNRSDLNRADTISHDRSGCVPYL